MSHVGQPNPANSFWGRAEHVLQRLEKVLNMVSATEAFSVVEPDWSSAMAFHLRPRPMWLGGAYLEPVRHLSALKLADLKEIDEQKKRFLNNLQQFVDHLPANNVLLTGARGTGKSSLVKACLNQLAPQGLRIIEVDKHDLINLPYIVQTVAHRPERFVVFCDDLSFEASESDYKALKSILDGSLAQASDNVLVVATSNRRHLLPEYHTENAHYRHTDDGEIHPSEGVEEKISLSERFGLWISFYPFTQEEYLTIVRQWLEHFGCRPEDITLARAEALVWALERGSRSGRVAQQFARDFMGRQQTKQMT